MKKINLGLQKDSNLLCLGLEAMESCTTCAYPLKEDFTHTDLALPGRLAINRKMRF